MSDRTLTDIAADGDLMGTAVRFKSYEGEVGDIRRKNGDISLFVHFNQFGVSDAWFPPGLLTLADTGGDGA